MWFEIAVSGFDRAKAFYGELLGWTFMPFDDFRPDYWMIETGADGVSGALVKRGQGTDAGRLGPILYFAVKDLPIALEKAKQLGASIVHGKKIITKTAGYFAQLQDPDGNLFALWSQE
ncbi:MAG: VOC family protein [Myxococcaceae bacterium]